MNELEVYLNAESLTKLAAYPGQLDPDLVEASLIRAINVWNEESLSGRRMHYRGRGQSMTSPQERLIYVVAEAQSPPGVGGCSVGALARAYSGLGGMGECLGSTTVALYVNDCPSLASGLAQSPLHWTSGWPTGNQIGLEAVLIHELGHAAFSIDDQIYQTTPQTPTYHGVMWGTYNNAQHGEGLNLYLVDQMTTIEGQADATGAPNGEGAGPTARHATVRTLDLSNQWVGPATPLPEPSTFGPGLAAFRYPFEAHGYFAGHPNLIDFGLQLRRGAPASWVDYLGPYPTATAHGTVQHTWVSLATTPYGETAAAWLSCTGLPQCRVIVATATSPTAELTAQMVGESSFARPEIAYDRWRDRFVLFFIHRDGTLRQSETTPWNAAYWTYEQEVPTEEPGTLRFRYMGGLVFDYTQEAASNLPFYYGSFFGALADVSPGNALNAIVELSLGYDATMHRYRLGQAELPIAGSDPHLFETVRHFDVVADLNADHHTLTWVRPTQGGAQAVYIARRNGVVGAFQPPVALPWPNNEPVYSSVSISPSPENEYHYALTVGGQP